MQFAGDSLSFILHRATLNLHANDLRLLRNATAQQRGPGKRNQREGTDNAERPEQSAQCPPWSILNDLNVAAIAQLQPKAVDGGAERKAARGGEFTDAGKM